MDTTPLMTRAERGRFVPLGPSHITVMGDGSAMVLLAGDSGMVAMIDEADIPLVEGRRWRAQKNRNTFYARSFNPYVSMHRLIAGFPDGILVDHRDGDGLNNRRENLRRSDYSGNSANQTSRRGSSAFKGVHWRARDRKWRAQLRFAGEHIHIGEYTSEIEAAKAYDSAAKQYFGQFAKLNFPA